MYVKDIQTKICEKDGEPVIEKESPATALVDGKNLLGPVVGNFCMDLAIKKAKEVGIGWVVAHGERLRCHVIYHYTANCEWFFSNEEKLIYREHVQSPTCRYSKSHHSEVCHLWTCKVIQHNSATMQHVFWLMTNISCWTHLLSGDIIDVKSYFLCVFVFIGSNHYGIAGYYSMQALKSNMIVSQGHVCLVPCFQYLHKGLYRTVCTKPPEPSTGLDHEVGQKTDSWPVDDPVM